MYIHARTQLYFCSEDKIDAASDWWRPDKTGSAATWKDDSLEHDKDKEADSQLPHVRWCALYLNMKTQAMSGS